MISHPGFAYEIATTLGVSKDYANRLLKYLFVVNLQLYGMGVSYQ